MDRFINPTTYELQPMNDRDTPLYTEFTALKRNGYVSSETYDLGWFIETESDAGVDCKHGLLLAAGQ